MKQKIGLMSLGEKTLFQEAKTITIKQNEQTLKEKEILKDSLVRINYYSMKFYFFNRKNLTLIMVIKSQKQQ